MSIGTFLNLLPLIQNCGTTIAWVIGAPGSPLKPFVPQGVGNRIVFREKNLAASIARSRFIKIGPFTLVFTKEKREIAYLLDANWLTIIRDFSYSNFDKSIPSTRISIPKIEIFSGITCFLTPPMSRLR
jgi:hypothetical protein